MTIDELQDRTIPEPNSGCWLWLGNLDRWGYGVVSTRPYLTAHRASYELHKGGIPSGALVLHSCDQACCANPDHLRLGTHADNSDDRVRRGRAAGARGAKHGSAKLTKEQVDAIRADKRSLRPIADEYGVIFGGSSRAEWGLLTAKRVESSVREQGSE